MAFLKNLFNKKESSVQSNSEFWEWFSANEKSFAKAIKKADNIEKEFFNKIAPKLNQLKEGVWFLAGINDENQSELILTPDGVIENIVFVEELVNASPRIPNWNFIALKPALDIENVSIEMSGYSFTGANISFYANEHTYYPDEIDLEVVYHDYNEEDKSLIVNGIYIFLDNFLGELNSVTTIDNLKVISKSEAQKELIPIAKLKAFLIWREKEFVEKYQGVTKDTENDNFVTFEATMENDLPLLAVINSDLLNWDSKASHPWVLTVSIKYNGDESNGMPDSETYQVLNDIEDQILIDLKDYYGYLNVGRQTADSVREIYFACVDFRKPAKVLHSVQKLYKERIEINFEIYKDKYWQSFNRFNRS